MTGLKRAAVLLMAPLLTAAGPPLDGVHTGLGVYSQTVERWKRAIKASDFPSTSWIFVSPTNGGRDRLHRNGRRDTILVVPEHAHLAQLTLIVWFHGLHGFSEKTFRNRLIPMLKHLSTKDRPVAMVIPEMPWSTFRASTRALCITVLACDVYVSSCAARLVVQIEVLQCCHLLIPCHP